MNSLLLICTLSASLMLAGVKGTTLENSWLSVEVDPDMGGAVSSIVSRNNRVEHLRGNRDRNITNDPILGSLTTGGDGAIHGWISRFKIQGKEFQGKEMGSWEVLSSTRHSLKIYNSTYGITIQYDLPEDQAILHKRIKIKNNTESDIGFIDLFNMQVGGDYKTLTEPAGDFVFFEEGKRIQALKTQEIQETDIRPSQPWIAIVDRNKNQALGIVLSDTLEYCTAQTVNELDRESLIIGVHSVAVPPRKEAIVQTSVAYLEEINGISYLNPQVAISLQSKSQNLLNLRIISLVKSQKEEVRVELQEGPRNLPLKDVAITPFYNEQITVQSPKIKFRTVISSTPPFFLLPHE